MQTSTHAQKKASQVQAFELEQVGASLGQNKVFSAFDLTLPGQGWISVVGPNGAGKSTLLKVLAGLLPCTGRLHFLGKPLDQWSAQERARSLAWLGQNEGVVSDLRVYDVVMLGRLPYQSWLGMPSPQDHTAVELALHQTQTFELHERGLEQLSGGERQRVLLARALAVQAKVLLMDEPLMHLDPPHQAEWIMLVRQLVALGTVVVSVLHEVSIALQADCVVVLQEGALVHQGNPESSSTQRALEQVFANRIAIHQVAGQRVAVPVLEVNAPRKLPKRRTR